jgi:hypothetical protein
MIVAGGNDDWSEPERRDHRVGSVIAAALAVMAFCAAVLNLP